MLDTSTLNILIFLSAVCILPLVIIAILYLGSGFIRNLKGIEEIERRNYPFSLPFRTWLPSQETDILKDIPTLSYLGDGVVIVCDKDKHIFRSVDHGLTWTDLGILPGEFKG